MSVRVWKGVLTVDTLGHYNFGPNVVLETSEVCMYMYTYIYIYRPCRHRWEATGGHGRPREAPWRWENSEANSRAQMLFWGGNLVLYYQRRQDP